MVRTSVKWPFCTTSVGLLFSCARVVPPTNNHTSRDTTTRGQSFLLLTRLRTTPLSPVLRLPSRKRSCTATEDECGRELDMRDRKSTRLNSSHDQISYAVFCLKKKKKQQEHTKCT